jgi:fructose/tagatose bisphosphate aldolase
MATPDHYVAMLDRAKEGGFAYPAINVTSSQTLNAALQGFAEADSDGIIQVSLGTALYLSGNTVQNRFAGSKALALYAHEVASHYSELYSTVDDARATIKALGAGERGRYLTALTFGNVHGVYHPDSVHLRPEILDEIQTVIGGETGRAKPFDLVFHGGSGSSVEDIASAVASGVVKMNVDTDTQYAFTRSIAGHMIGNYEQVLKVDGAYGNKKAYDPRSWGKPAENAMAARVVEAAQMLGSAGRAMR